MRGMEGKGWLKEVCFIFYEIFFFLLFLPNLRYWNLLSSDSVRQSPHTYTFSFSQLSMETKRQEQMAWSLGRGKEFTYKGSWLCAELFSSYLKTKELTWPRSTSSVLLETDPSCFKKGSLQTALVTASIKMIMEMEGIIALWVGQGTMSG